MRRLEFDTLDQGRLVVNRQFLPLLRRHELVTFGSLMDEIPGQPVKALLGHRTTSRVELSDGDGTQAFYIKRHDGSPLGEYVKPLLRLSRPSIGAGDEWRAMIRFHELGIPTMTPVAFGRRGRRSFSMSLAIEGCVKLSAWIEQNLAEPSPEARAEARAIARGVARVARSMHGAHLHHQDFYLGHLLKPAGADPEPIYVIDLGRVRRFRWGRLRWIVKDLGQLDFSAEHVSRTDRVRFLRAYLDRPLRRADRLLVGLIQRKSRAIRRRVERRAARSA